MRLAPSVPLVAVLLALAGCPADPAGPPPGGDDDGDDPDASVLPHLGVDAGPDDPCAGEGALACLFARHDAARASCDAADLADLEASLAARPGQVAWHAGRALFVTRGAPAAIAGVWNGWDAGAPATTSVCGTGLHTLVVELPTGRWPYKVVEGGSWSLDPLNWSYVHDEGAGPERRNSVVVTYDDPAGQLAQPPDELCADDLGCRGLRAYLPPGYDAPANALRRYPVVFLHDGQNVFAEGACCFGHGGWELDHAMDAGIADGAIGEAILVGVDNGPGRGAEYGGALVDAFMAFQVDVAQPAAAARWRLDAARTYVAGSSLGGLVSYRLAWAYPEVYAGAASLSGAFWYGKAEGHGMRDVVLAEGARDVALYLDHGGTFDDGGDDLPNSVELRDLLEDEGFAIATSPACTAGPRALCYHHEPGATHDELAWRARAWRFLSYLLPPG